MPIIHIVLNCNYIFDQMYIFINRLRDCLTSSFCYRHFLKERMNSGTSDG